MQNIVSFPKKRIKSFKSVVYYRHDISFVLNDCGNTNIIMAFFFVSIITDICLLANFMENNLCQISRKSVGN